MLRYNKALKPFSQKLRKNMTDAERRWFRENRPPHATHWNMLSTVNASELANAF